MIVIPYQVTLLEPLLATRIAGDPNSAVSYPYIPGSALRGAMVSAYMRKRKLTALDAGQEEAQRLFFDGRTRYLNAYPIASEDKRMLPTPRTWFTVKGTDGPVYDFAHEIPVEQPKQFSAVAGDTRPFCLVEEGDVRFHEQLRRVTVHTQRERVKGRALEEAGAVFQYDALEEGQVFAGYVLADDSEDAPLLETLLSGYQKLGGSSNSGYGRVRISIEATIDPSQRHWREVDRRTAALTPHQSFVVTLLSDTLVRDSESGQYTVNLKSVLEAALGVTLHTLQSSDSLEDEQRSGWRVEDVGGFNRTWGLPLPQAQAIGAGSVFVFVSSEAVESEAIVAAEWQGIGERRAEGFGRLAIDWQTSAQLRVEAENTTPTLEPVPELTGVAYEMALAATTRMLRRELDNKLRKRINDLAIEPVKAISNAQLSRFRVIARDALLAGDTERLITFLAEIKKRRSAREQFERLRISNQRFTDWLGERLNDPARVWQDIGAENLERHLGSNVRVHPGNDEMLAREYVIRLIDGLLAKAAQTRREQEDRE